jgi:hypothetical protein
MNFARRFAIAASAVLLTLVAVAPAMADLLPETAQYFGTLRVNIANGNETWAVNPNGVDLAGDVYNNTNPQAPANFGFSSTDLASIFGDRVTTTGTGLLQENDFTVYNSNTSAGPLLTAQYLISFYDGPSSTLIGQYLANLNFGTGLPAGFFAIATLTSLGPLSITLGTQDVIVTQQIVSKTGTANKLGIASLDPPSIGSSTNTMYINSLTVGPAGFYNVGNPPLNANPGYRINVSTAVPTHNGSWGQVKAMYH